MKPSRIFAKAAAGLAYVLAALLMTSCGPKEAERRFENLDTEWFSCRFIADWNRPRALTDGMLFQESRLWQRNSPDRKGAYSISIHLYEGTADKAMQRFSEGAEPSTEIGEFHTIRSLDNADGTPSGYTVESWGFRRDNNLVVVGYQYPDGDEALRETLRRQVIDSTLHTLRMK